MCIIFDSKRYANNYCAALFYNWKDKYVEEVDDIRAWDNFV